MNNLDYRVLKKRYVGLDLLRTVSALVVCMFHTTIHLGCDYGPLQGFSQMGAVFMTVFFMLSGFSLFVNWGGGSLTSISDMKKFWKKRFLGIMPMYWCVGLIYTIMQLFLHKETLLTSLILFPIEFLGLQSVFSSLFGYSHNSGTWFISCIMICYIAYPFLQEFVKSITKKCRVLLLVLSSVILLYAPIVVHVLELSNVYSNPFFRLLEFLIGIILAAMKVDFSESKFVKKILCSWWMITGVGLLMIAAVSVAVKLNIGLGNYMLYSWICLPCFMLILIGLSGVESRLLEKSKVLKWLSSITYVFFLAQLFSNSVSKKIINLAGIDSNIIKIFLGWGVCFAIAMILRLIEIRIKKFHTRTISDKS